MNIRIAPHHARGALVLAAAAALAAALCAAAPAQAQDPASGGGGGKTPFKADLSTAKSAFESFAAELVNLTTASMKDVMDAFARRESEALSAALTDGFRDFLRKREAAEAPEAALAGAQKLEYVREKTGADGSVTVFAVQKPSPAGGKASGEGPKAAPVRSMLVFEKSGDSYRIREWLEECQACSGTGVCPACGGEGVTRERKCPECGGTGKKSGGAACEACDGKGILGPAACRSCEGDRGACRTCSGRGGLRRDVFDTSGLIGDLELKESGFRGLGAPEEAVKTYLDLERALEAVRCRAVAKFTAELRRMITGYFPKDALDKFDAAVKRSTAEFQAGMEGMRREIGRARSEEGAEIVLVTTETGGITGESHRELMYFRAVLKDGAWKIADRAGMCRDCLGDGSCGMCGGTGKKGNEACPACAASPGKCAMCGGFKYQWERKASD